MNENCADQPLCQPILVIPAKSLAYCLFTNVVFNYSHFVRLHFLSPESYAPVWQTKNRCFLILKIDASSICLSTKAWRIAYLYKIPHTSEKISISPDAFHKQLLIYSAVKLGYILKWIRQCALHEPWWGRAHALQWKRESDCECEFSLSSLNWADHSIEGVTGIFRVSWVITQWL